MPYQVGDLEFFTEDDPVFEDRVDAESKAIEISRGNDATIGVWTSQEEGSDLVSIAHQGELFRK